MLAKDIISENIPPLKIKDTGAKAIEWMYEFKLSHLPLVDHQNYIGLVSEEDILDFNDTHEQLGKFLKNLYKPFVKDTEHIYEVLRVAANLKTTVIPVISRINYPAKFIIQFCKNEFHQRTGWGNYYRT